LYNLTVSTGIGTWGLNKQWAYGISQTSFGGLVSVTLNFNFCGITLFRQRWRMAINRSAEAMTIFSVIQAGLFPITHGASMVGVLGFAYTESIWFLWVNFNSLLWDVFAISTYLSVSLVFWWTGLLPDFAMLRDRAITPFNKREFILY
jgi:molybdopterin-containing oxidoreductase family membrane subunit